MIPVFYKTTDGYVNLEEFKIRSVITKNSKRIKELMLDYLHNCIDVDLSDSVSISLALENDDFVSKLVLVNDLSYASCAISLMQKGIRAVEVRNFPPKGEIKNYSQTFELWIEKAEEIRVFIDGISNMQRCNFIV